MDNPISLTTVTELFNHNYWARDRQLQTCQKLTEEQFCRPMGSSFTSIRDTLVHLMAVEWIWLERWRGQGPTTLWDPASFPTLTSIQSRWVVEEKAMREYLSELDDNVIQQSLTIVSTRGQSWTFPLWRMMMHLLNHQSYHRGQITTLLRQMDVVPPKVDFLDAHEAEFRV